jgi:hypothetical protein
MIKFFATVTLTVCCLAGAKAFAFSYDNELAQDGYMQSSPYSAEAYGVAYDCHDGQQWLTDDVTTNGDWPERVLLTCVAGRWVNTYANLPARGHAKAHLACREGEHLITDGMPADGQSDRVVSVCHNGRFERVSPGCN